MDIPNAAVEAAARAAYEDGFLRHAKHYYPLTWEEIGDGARESWRAIVRAAAPHIAAQALRDAADDDFTAAAHIRRVGYLRLRDRADRIEADRG